MERHHQYVVASLELHLFFARIMKEHALFLEAGFTPANASLAKEADQLREQFEMLLLKTVRMADGLIRRKVLDSGEIVTEFTANAERQTEQFTGIAINREITRLESALSCGEEFCPRPEFVRRVQELNRTALRLLSRLIRLKERILHFVASCRMFTMNYPLLIRHILREARLYQSYIVQLENGRPLDDRFMLQTEQFWNRIMICLLYTSPSPRDRG